MPALLPLGVRAALPLTVAPPEAEEPADEDVLAADAEDEATAEPVDAFTEDAVRLVATLLIAEAVAEPVACLVS
jgi:hypothetical protein